jgi:hypothetical protein
MGDQGARFRIPVWPTKEILMKYFFILILLFSVHAHAEFNFDSQITDRGEFSIDLDFTFEKNMEIKDITSKYILNESYQKLLDSMLTKQEIRNIRKTRYGRRYDLFLKAKKELLFIDVHNSFIFSCFEEVTTNEVRTSCVLNTTKGSYNGRDRFNHLSYNFNCFNYGGDIKCDFDLVGKVRPISMLVYKRTSHRLAASGVQKYLTNMYQVYSSMGQNKLKKMDLHRDSFFLEKVNTVRSRFFNYMNSNDELLVAYVDVSGKSVRWWPYESM